MQERSPSVSLSQGYGYKHPSMLRYLLVCSLLGSIVACQGVEEPQKPLDDNRANHTDDNFGTMRLFPTGLAALSLSLIQEAIAFNAPSDVPSWCGKPYMNT